jgi:hypothetical protein
MRKRRDVPVIDQPVAVNPTLSVDNFTTGKAPFPIERTEYDVPVRLRGNSDDEGIIGHGGHSP